MTEYMMGKSKHVGDDLNLTDLGDGMLVLGTPDVAYNPITKQNEKISKVVKAPTQTTCPNCKQCNDPGVQITFLETEYFVYACPLCNQFVWCRFKGDKP